MRNETDAAARYGSDSATQRAEQRSTDMAAAFSDEPIMRFFEYRHLPPKLSGVSAPFSALAAQLYRTLPRSAERTVALRKLLESKDAAVRAAL